MRKISLNKPRKGYLTATIQCHPVKIVMLHQTFKIAGQMIETCNDPAVGKMVGYRFGNQIDSVFHFPGECMPGFGFNNQVLSTPALLHPLMHGPGSAGRGTGGEMPYSSQFPELHVFVEG